MAMCNLWVCAIAAGLLFIPAKGQGPTAQRSLAGPSQALPGGGGFFQGNSRSCSTNTPCYFQAIADLDKQSALTDTHDVFKTYLQRGSLILKPKSAETDSPEATWLLSVLEGTDYDEKKRDELKDLIDVDLRLYDGGSAIEIRGKLSEGGRGLELSELALYDNHILSFDDRSGMLYELGVEDVAAAAGATVRYDPSRLRSSLPPRREQERTKRERLRAALASPDTPFLGAKDGKNGGGEVKGSLKLKMMPVVPLVEGDGMSSTKGMKVEWATVKDGELIVGSQGREYITSDGHGSGDQNMWVARLGGQISPALDSASPQIQPNQGSATADDGESSGSELIWPVSQGLKEYWGEKFLKLREVTNTTYPGYLLHEAVEWSAALRKWVFLPRRVSYDDYDEKTDELRGSNMLLHADEDFSNVEVFRVKFAVDDPKRGFSSFKFVPGSDDRLIIALRSAEDEAKGEQRTYVSVFPTFGGQPLLDELSLSDVYKFEGIILWA